MTWNKSHPASSHAFLSRLHDGDLEPSERAHFEAHRAHCSACRAAAADYERALSLFRSARPSPAPADMAGRVLRKLQALETFRRTPFGSLFAVDWRWAGAFAAALLVLLIGAPFALRRQEGASRAQEPILVAVQDREKPAPPAVPEPPAAAAADRASPGRPAAADLRKQAAPAPYAAEPSGDSRQARLEQRDSLDVAAAKPDAPEAKLEAGAAREKAQSNAASEAQTSAQAPAAGGAAGILAQNQINERFAPQSKTAHRGAVPAPVPPAPASPVQEQSGGEGSREPVLVSGNVPSLDRPSRLLVQSLDALGSAPEVVARPEEPDLTPLRGRTFVLQVDASGRVRDAKENVERNQAVADGKRRDAELAKEKDATSGPFKRLLFKPDGRSRRLLLRVE